MEKTGDISTTNVAPEISVEPSSEFIENSEEFNREETEEYIKRRDLEQNASPNPEVIYLNKTIFPLLTLALIEMLEKVRDDDSFSCSRSTLNGLDYLSEILYNRNPNHPERESNWTYIFDMQWVQSYLEKHPRPYYPFHLIWSRNTAALKIQSFLRGYWVRCRRDVQELRQFWKVRKISAKSGKVAKVSHVFEQEFDGMIMAFSNIDISTVILIIQADI